MAEPEPSKDRGVSAWLWLCVALLFLMIVVGGLTRLTGSGLSMVRWEPVVGALPPLDQSDWEKVFALYRETPEFRLKNSDMDLHGFKSIFWLEYFHRLLGRSIGLIVFLPLVFFALRKRITRARTLTLLGIFALGGLQGLVGWLMVKSGLNALPNVSHYRLTLHMGLGVLLFGLVLWQALEVSRPGDAERNIAMPPGLKRWIQTCAFFLFIVILSGALVAGLKAGYAYPTFPKMLGAWIPPGLGAMSPAWRNLFDNPLTVQFQHRIVALSALVFVGLTTVAIHRSPAPSSLRRAARWLAAAMALQVLIGIGTLLMHVPIAMASLHQANAVVAFGLSLNLWHWVGKGHRNTADSKLALSASPDAQLS